MNRTIASAALAGALLLGGAGAAILPSLVAAADPTAAPSAATTAPSTNGTDPAGRQHGPGGPGGMHVETVTDASVAAAAIGISEADLTTALQSGKSLADVAAANNVDVQKVIDALVADEQAEIAAAVTAGTETQAQADTELANLVQRITDRVNHAGFGPGGPGKGGPGGPGGMHVETVTDASVAAAAIGISEADLTTALQSGKSLADVAAANNVDVQKVIDALVADEQAEIAAAVTAGTETQAQADTELANLVQRITDRVNHAGFDPGAGGPGGHAGGPGMGGPGGPGGPGGHHGDPNQAPATTTTPAG